MTVEKTASEQVENLAAALKAPTQTRPAFWNVVAALACLLLAGAVVCTSYHLEKRAQNTSVALASLESGTTPTGDSGSTTEDGAKDEAGDQTGLVGPIILAAGTADGDSTGDPGSDTGDGEPGTPPAGTTPPTGTTTPSGTTDGGDQTELEPATEGPGEAPWAFAIAALGAAVFLLTGRVPSENSNGGS